MTIVETFGMAYQGNLKAVLLITTLTDTNAKHPVHHDPRRCWCITWTHARSFPLGLEPANESWRRPAGACPSAWWRWGRLSSAERWTRGPEGHGVDARHFPPGQFCELDDIAKNVLATSKRMCRHGVIHTSILPPTRASRGGRGLSFSFFSCRRECLRPPTMSTKRNLRDQGARERVWMWRYGKGWGIF